MLKKPTVASSDTDTLPTFPSHRLLTDKAGRFAVFDGTQVLLLHQWTETWPAPGYSHRKATDSEIRGMWLVTDQVLLLMYEFTKIAVAIRPVAQKKAVLEKEINELDEKGRALLFAVDVLKELAPAPKPESGLKLVKEKKDVPAT